MHSYRLLMKLAAIHSPPTHDLIKPTFIRQNSDTEASQWRLKQKTSPFKPDKTLLIIHSLLVHMFCQVSQQQWDTDYFHHRILSFPVRDVTTSTAKKRSCLHLQINSCAVLLVLQPLTLQWPLKQTNIMNKHVTVWFRIKTPRTDTWYNTCSCRRFLPKYTSSISRLWKREKQVIKVS